MIPAWRAHEYAPHLDPEMEEGCMCLLHRSNVLHQKLRCSSFEAASGLSGGWHLTVQAWVAGRSAARLRMERGGRGGRGRGRGGRGAGGRGEGANKGVWQIVEGEVTPTGKPKKVFMKVWPLFPRMHVAHSL